MKVHCGPDLRQRRWSAQRLKLGLALICLLRPRDLSPQAGEVEKESYFPYLARPSSQIDDFPHKASSHFTGEIRGSLCGTRI